MCAARYGSAAAADAAVAPASERVLAHAALSAADSRISSAALGRSLGSLLNIRMHMPFSSSLYAFGSSGGCPC